MRKRGQIFLVHLGREPKRNVAIKAVERKIQSTDMLAIFIDIVSFVWPMGNSLNMPVKYWGNEGKCSSLEFNEERQ